MTYLGLMAWAAARAQSVTNAPVPSDIPNPAALETPGATARLLPATLPSAPPATNPAPASAPGSSYAPAAEPASSPGPLPPGSTESSAVPVVSEATLLAAFLTAGTLAGAVFYLCGLSRAKNCAHTSTLLLLGTVLALTGYWAGGFAVQTGGIGDAHAALPALIPVEARGALDHEIGLMAAGHHWGLMGSAGYFLSTDAGTRGGLAALFFVQAAWLIVALAGMLGGGLERGRLLALGVVAFLVGAVIFPLAANWVWGGGWLAALGHEFGLGHGVVDLAGAGVVHLTAGTVALVLALVLGPRHGRFERGRATAIPGHNVPFLVAGAVLLLLAWTAGNAFAAARVSPDATVESLPGLAAVNVLLGAIGGVLVMVILSAWRRQRASPARLVRGLLGGAVAVSGGSAFFDPWAAWLIGAVAALLVDAAVLGLERARIDDPSAATAVHGAAGFWGLLATGLFADDAMAHGLNRVDSPVRGLFFGGAWHQLAAQAVGAAAIFLTVLVLALAALFLVQKVLGNRVRLTDEIHGLDWPQTGALGYQPDVEPDGPPER